MNQAPGDQRSALLGGSVDGGRYVLGPLLGEGGMAAVHQAHDTRLDRTVAIKTMHSELGRESAFRQRFQREAQAVARLNHPNVVAVHDSGEEPVAGGAPIAYIVMEYVRGGSLSDLLRADVAAHGRMDTDKALRITGEVLAALGASHEHGMVHRDIKPGNVMVTERGQVKVMDFGIARAQESGGTALTQTGMMVGTPQYLSPEQAEGCPVDGRSDLYSVGVMLFQLLSGRLPFDGGSAFTIAYKHVTEPPPELSSLGVTVSPGVRGLVMRALEKDPGRRFPTADAMREEAERVRAGGGGGGPSAPPTHAPTALDPQARPYGYPAAPHSPPPAPPPTPVPAAPPSPAPAPGYAAPAQGHPGPPATPYPQRPATPYPQPVPQRPATPYPQPGPQPGFAPPPASFATPQPGPYPPPRAAVQASNRPDNTAATLGAVLGAISVPLVFMLIGFGTAIAGLISSVKGVQRSDRIGGVGRKPAIAGVLLSVIALIVGICFLIYVGNTADTAT